MDAAGTSNLDGYNPDEWEECKESPFLWWWRVLATISTVVLAVMFYYYVEQNKRNMRKLKNKKEDEQEHLTQKYDYSSSHRFGDSEDGDSSIRRRVVQDTKESNSSQWASGSTTRRVVQDTKQSNSSQWASDSSSRTSNEQKKINERSEMSVHNSSHLTKSPDASTADDYEITNVLHTVEVTLRQKNSANNSEANSRKASGENNLLISLDDNAVASRRSNDTSPTSNDLDSLTSDSWEKVERIHLLAHDKVDGLMRDADQNSTEMRKSPGKPMFVSELKVKSNENENGTEDSDEETTNSILEIAKVQTTEELLMQVKTLEAITEIMRQAGLESSNLIFGIDYTASNKYQGEESFNGQSLHAIGSIVNPYQHVIAILGKTMAPFANSGFIAAYGFGDVRTSDTDVFPLNSVGFCTSFAEVLNMYNEITPSVILSGPTNFAPLIYQAINICKQVKDYHILVIVADGQVTNEKATTRAIVEACRYPLSIIVVGVGDGPWEMMRIFDEKLPKRKWDNFHFVEFHKVTSKAENPDLAFAIQALVEIPDQFKKIKSLGLLDFANFSDEE